MQTRLVSVITGRQRGPRSIPVPDRSLRGCVLNLTCAGSCRFRMRDRSIRTGAGDLLIMPPGWQRLPSIPSGHDWRWLLVLIDHPPDWLWEEPDTPQCRVLHLKPELRRQAVALCRELADLLAEPDDRLRDALAWHRLALFLLQILRRGRLPIGGDERIEQALRLLHADPGASWDVAGLASRVGLGRSRFSQRFTRLLGCPPAHYAEKLRLERACTLLLDGSLRIADVASSLGYSDRRHFTRRFRTRYGCTPRAWRSGS